ncbi:hypothetical protein EJB05_06302, partial [Eragrostis curvula]
MWLCGRGDCLLLRNSNQKIGFWMLKTTNISEVSTSFSEMSVYTTRSTKASSSSVMSSSDSKSRGARRQTLWGCSAHKGLNFRGV